MNKTDHAALIAAFLARGGKVNVVQPGERSDRQRNEKPIYSDRFSDSHYAQSEGREKFSK